MKITIPTYEQTKRIMRITLTAFLAMCGVVCLYAVLFMHRPDHLLTTAGYALLVWAVNIKDEDKEQ